MHRHKNTTFNITYETYGLNLLRKSILHINNLTRHHNGTYTCTTEIHTNNHISVDLVVQGMYFDGVYSNKFHILSFSFILDKPSGLKLSKFVTTKENLTYIEWQLTDSGDSTILCAEALFKNVTEKTKTVTYCMYLVICFVLCIFCLTCTLKNRQLRTLE